MAFHLPSTAELIKMSIPGPHLTPILVPLALNLHFNEVPKAIPILEAPGLHEKLSLEGNGATAST